MATASDFQSGGLSHLDERGAAHMVDVTEKSATRRTAVAAERLTHLDGGGGADLHRGPAQR